jgi:putative transposase
MPRIARIIVPHYPHHIIQRGNRSQPVFFSVDDKHAYLALLISCSREHGLHVLAYCLMDNHVHLIIVPETREGMTVGIAELHRKYTWRINQRENWRGHLWQGRFSSYVMDERHLIRAVRYIERNPVVAGIVERAEDYRWSSAHAHIVKTNDRVLSTTFEYVNFAGWSEYVNTANDDDNEDELQGDTLIQTRLIKGTP